MIQFRLIPIRTRIERLIPMLAWPCMHAESMLMPQAMCSILAFICKILATASSDSGHRQHCITLYRHGNQSDPSSPVTPRMQAWLTQHLHLCQSQHTWCPQGALELARPRSHHLQPQIVLATAKMQLLEGAMQDAAHAQQPRAEPSAEGASSSAVPHAFDFTTASAQKGLQQAQMSAQWQLMGDCSTSCCWIICSQASMHACMHAKLSSASNKIAAFATATTPSCLTQAMAAAAAAAEAEVAVFAVIALHILCRQSCCCRQLQQQL